MKASTLAKLTPVFSTKVTNDKNNKKPSSGCSGCGNKYLFAGSIVVN